MAQYMGMAMPDGFEPIRTANLMTYKQLDAVAQPGDLIFIDRGPFYHVAMYSEKAGKVYNVCAEDKSKDKAKIKLLTLKEVCLSNPDIYHQKGYIDNVETAAARRHNIRGPRPTADIIKAAKKMDGTSQPYDFMGRNCEYYCTLWRYGKGFSTQVENGTMGFKSY